MTAGDFRPAQEFLDNRANRILELVTKGVPSVAFPWKRTFFDELTMLSHLPEGRRVNYISLKVLTCSGLYAPQGRAGFSSSLAPYPE